MRILIIGGTGIVSTGITRLLIERREVENLDDLLVRLVEEELAWQNPRLAQGQ